MHLLTSLKKSLVKPKSNYSTNCCNIKPICQIKFPMNSSSSHISKRIFVEPIFFKRRGNSCRRGDILHILQIYEDGIQKLEACWNHSGLQLLENKVIFTNINPFLLIQFCEFIEHSSK